MGNDDFAAYGSHQQVDVLGRLFAGYAWPPWTSFAVEKRFCESALLSGESLIGFADGDRATKRFNLACRHSRESGGVFQQQS